MRGIGFTHVIQQTVDAEVDVNVNSVNQGTFSALSDINVNVTDGTDPVTPDAVIVSGQNIEIQVPAASASVGATLLKTGQTTSYRAGDDGDIEAGRATNFTTLASNNPFGNTNRFTDELGGQTYTNNIVIDWSTYDGSTVLGYKRTLRATGINWADSIDEAIALNIGDFASGWRMVNIREMLNIMDFSKTSTNLMNYTPFNITYPGTIFWTSTTRASATTAVYGWSNADNIAQYTKTNTASLTYIACRTFTVVGTTLS